MAGFALRLAAAALGADNGQATTSRQQRALVIRPFRRKNLAIAPRFPEDDGGLALATGGAWAASHARAADSLLGPPELPQGTLASSVLDALPGKVPLIKKSWRPPNFETPVSYFNDTFTPNSAFFVRYQLSNIPEVAAATWRLKVGGEAVGTPFELSLDELKRDFEPVEFAAVCQCSGNRRGMFQPHVPGVE